MLGLAALAALALAPSAGDAQSLRGSKPSVEKMYWFAQSHRMAFHRTEESILGAANQGRLVPLTGGPGYELARGVGWPYVTADTRRFVETFAPQFENACGAPLVITSAARPISRQPRNANPHSVHPAGIAIDLRRPPPGPCLDWLRAALLELERRGFVEATEERRPVHFHVAVLTPPGRARSAPTLQLAVAGINPRRQRVVTVSAGEVEPGGTRSILANIRHANRSMLEVAVDRPIRPERAEGNMAFARILPMAGSVTELASGFGAASSATPAPVTTTASADSSERETHDDVTPAAQGRTYRVRPGDTLWDLSRRLHVPVKALQQANKLGRRATLKPGMELRIPEVSDHAARR